MDNENICKISVEAAVVNAMINIRKLQSRIDPEEINEAEPSLILNMVSELINLLHVSIKVSDRASEDSMDAYVYMHAALCHQESVVEVIKDYNPEEKFLDKDETKALESLNGILKPFCDTFYKLHAKFHDEKCFYLEDYEKPVNELLKLSKKYHSDVSDIYEYKEEIRFKNVSREDVDAVIKMANSMEDMEDIADEEVAQAVAAYINRKLKDGRTAKDLDELDLMNLCLGYSVFNLEDDDEKERLKEFVSKFVPTEQAKGKLLLAELPSFKLSGNRLLCFEPELANAIPSEIEEEVSKVMFEKIRCGMTEMYKLTPEDKSNEDLIGTLEEAYKNKSLENIDKAKDALERFLDIWAGEENNKAEDPESDSPKYDGGLLYDLLGGNNTLEIKIEVLAVLGFIWNHGPKELVETLFNEEIAPEVIFMSINSAKDTLIEKGYALDFNRESGTVNIRWNP